MRYVLSFFIMDLIFYNVIIAQNVIDVIDFS